MSEQVIIAVAYTAGFDKLEKLIRAEKNHVDDYSALDKEMDAARPEILSLVNEAKGMISGRKRKTDPKERKKSNKKDAKP